MTHTPLYNVAQIPLTNLAASSASLTRPARNDLVCSKRLSTAFNSRLLIVKPNVFIFLKDNMPQSRLQKHFCNHAGWYFSLIYNACPCAVEFC